jgi:hypothetical protein
VNHGHCRCAASLAGANAGGDSIRSAVVDGFAHQLLARGIGNGSDGHVGGGESAVLSDLAPDTETGEQFTDARAFWS